MKPEWRNRSISDWQKVADQSLDTVEENDEPPTEIDSNGNKFWYDVKGQLHRDNDKPAVEWASGTKEWFVNEKRHRDNDKPAIEWVSGDKEWWVNGQLHRDNDKPAVEWADGYKAWWENGKFIRREDA